MRVRGIVAKTGKGQYSYYVVLDGDEKYYNTKFEPKCNPGDDVGIEFEPKGDKRGNIQKLKVLNAGAQPPPAQPAASSGGFKRGAAGGDARQDSIVWQHSQEIATRLLTVMLQSGATSLPKTGGAEVLKGMFQQLTYEAFRDALDPRNSEAYKTGSAADKDLDGARDTSGEDDDSWGDDEPAKEPKKDDDAWGDDWAD